MWGVYWMPLLYLEGLGLIGAAAGTALYMGCLVALIPVMIKYRQLFISQWRVLLLSGVLTGCAFSLYTTSLAYTDVIRSILLFYLTPVWGTLIGIFVLNERLTMTRLGVIICAFLGLYAILGSGGGLPIPRNLGDILALLSGMFWALGSLGLLRAKQVPVMPQIVSFLGGSLVISLLSIWLIGSPVQGPITAADWGQLIGFLGLFVVFALPMFWLTLAPARVLSPAKVGILLMSEVIVGAISAMMFSGQPFGTAELIGTILILAAAFIEVRGSATASTS